MKDDEFLTICADIATGLSVHKACRKNDFFIQQFYPFMSGSPERIDHYIRARAARADVRFDAMDELMDEIKSGVVEPNAARVLVDCIKWMAGKEKAKVYGDKPADIIINNDSRKQTLNVTDQALRLLTTDQLLQLQKIADAQPATIDQPSDK